MSTPIQEQEFARRAVEWVDDMIGPDLTTPDGHDLTQHVTWGYGDWHDYVTSIAKDTLESYDFIDVVATVEQELPGVLDEVPSRGATVRQFLLYSLASYYATMIMAPVLYETKRIMQEVVDNAD